MENKKYFFTFISQIRGESVEISVMDGSERLTMPNNWYTGDTLHVIVSRVSTTGITVASITFICLRHLYACYDVPLCIDRFNRYEYNVYI